MDKGPELLSVSINNGQRSRTLLLVSTILKQHKCITCNYNEKRITLFKEKKKIISFKHMYVQVSESKSINLEKKNKNVCV